MAWLWRIFDQTQKIARLEGERDESFDRAEDLEARLFREIDSNRSREDAFAQQIVLLAGGGHIPRRTELGEPPRRELAQAEIEKTEDEKAEDAAFEERVNEVANGFIEDAARRGIDYTVEDTDILKARIRANPHDYLDN